MTFESSAESRRFSYDNPEPGSIQDDSQDSVVYYRPEPRSVPAISEAEAVPLIADTDVLTENHVSGEKKMEHSPEEHAGTSVSSDAMTQEVWYPSKDQGSVFQHIAEEIGLESSEKEEASQSESDPELDSSGPSTLRSPVPPSSQDGVVRSEVKKAASQDRTKPPFVVSKIEDDSSLEDKAA